MDLLEPIRATYHRIADRDPSRARAIRLLLGRGKERDIDIFPDDRIICSYPKSGNTWVRFLVANLLSPHKQVTWSTIDEIVPSIGGMDQRHMAKFKRPRALKSHQYYDHRYKRIVYVIRDPRDILVSYYYFDIKRGLIEDGHPIESYAESFLKGEMGATAILGSHGRWDRHVGSWIGAMRDAPGFVVVRYEDLIDDTMRELKRISSVLEIKASDDEMDRAVKLSTGDIMRELERQESEASVLLRNTRKDIPFIRKAEVGNWKDELPTEVSDRVVEEFHETMKVLGYRTD